MAPTDADHPLQIGGRLLASGGLEEPRQRTSLPGREILEIYELICATATEAPCNPPPITPYLFRDLLFSLFTARTDVSPEGFDLLFSSHFDYRRKIENTYLRRRLRCNRTLADSRSLLFRL